ncbi:MAG TPA: hypothetical protein VNH17_08720 [Streptosporangiaceae bacterium]|nr:hypothetical protein [Streptosporangiaceae bacterium]
MTGTCPDLLAALRQRERDLEADAAAVRARLEEVRDIIARLEGNPRKRPRKITVINMPQRVEGGIHTPDDTDPDPDDAA